MPFSGGTFTVYTPGNPVVTGTTISSTVHNATMTDFASGLSQTLLRDGSVPMSGSLSAANVTASGTVSADIGDFSTLNSGVLTLTTQPFGHLSGASTRTSSGTFGAYASASHTGDITPTALGGTIVVNTSGLYLLQANVSGAVATGASVVVVFAKNGTGLGGTGCAINNQTGGTITIAYPTVTVVALAATDTVTLQLAVIAGSPTVGVNEFNVVKLF